MSNPHPIEITELQQLFLSKETKEDIEDINNGEYTETKQYSSNAGILRGAFYTANVVKGKRKNYIHRVKRGQHDENDYDTHNNYQQALTSAMNSAFMNAIGVRSHYVIYDNYLEHCGLSYAESLIKGTTIKIDNNFFLHTFLAFLIYGFSDRTLKNICINDANEFINIDLDDGNFSFTNQFPHGPKTTWTDEISNITSNFPKELVFLPDQYGNTSQEALNTINKTIAEMVNFDLVNVVKALIDEAVKFYKKDNNYQNMLFNLRAIINQYVNKVGTKLYLLSQGTFHQHFFQNYDNQYPLFHLMQQIANYENDIKTKANELLNFNLNPAWLDEYLTSKFEENINNNSLTQEQLSTIIRNNSFSMPKDSKLMQEINSTLQKNSLERLFGDGKYHGQQDIQARYNEKEFETKNFCQKCLDSISTCCGLCE